MHHRTLTGRIGRFATFASLALTACGGGDSSTTAPPPPPPPTVATVDIAPSSLTLVPAQTGQLTSTVKSSSGATLTDRTTTWISATASVATVNAQGLVTGVGPGTSIITATSEGKSQTITATVGDGGFVTALGSTFNAAGGAVTIAVPAGAVANATALTVAPLANPPAHPNMIPGTSFTLGPDGTTFAQPVSVSIRWETNQLPANTVLDQIRVHRYDGATWVPLGSGTVDVNGRVAQGTTTAFSPFALIQLPVNPAPTLSAISPDNRVANGGAFTLTATGTGFVATSVIHWNGSPRTTTFVSATQLTAAIPAGDVTAAATAQVTVVTPTPGGGTSAQRAFQISVAPPTAPVLTSISPDSRVANSGAFTLTATGSAFVATSVVHWNGSPRATTFVSATQLTAAILASDVTAASTAQVTVVTPAPGGGTSAQRALQITAAPAVGSIAVGLSHVCRAAVAGVTKCWGEGFYGQLGNGTAFVQSLVPTPVIGGFSFSALSTGGDFTCGLQQSGIVRCWGWNYNGQSGDGTFEESDRPRSAIAGTYSSITSGFGFTCGLTSAGAAWCWGDSNATGARSFSFVSSRIPVAVSGGKVFTSIAAGISHICGIDTSGAAWCWGANEGGQLGIGSRDHQLVPTAVLGGHTFTSISASISHTCGVVSGGSVYCWGAGGLGGNNIGAFGTVGDQLTPVMSGTGFSFTSVVASGNVTCGITTTNVTRCWGRSYLGNGTSASSPTPVVVSGGITFTKLFAGPGNICGLTAAGAAYCWGLGTSGQLGNNSVVPNSLVPVQVSGGLSFTTLSLGNGFLCGTTASGAAHCWGTDGAGQLGTGTVSNRYVPTPIAGGQTFTSVTAGLSGSGGLTAAGNAWCWGQNEYGEVGSGVSGGFRTVPVQVTGSQTFRQIGSGWFYRCALTTAGAAWCWGAGTDGQLGNGGTANVASPVAVSGGLTFASIGVAEAHTCAITSVGAAWCWGRGNAGQLGNGSTSSRTTPSVVSGNRVYSAITSADNHTCALDVAGAAFCWGYNFSGELGDGTNDDRTTPVAVSGGHVFSTIYAGGSFTCALKANGTAWCWGAGGFAMGNGSEDNRTSPTAVGGGHIFSVLSVGPSLVCGVKANNETWCWGYGANGKIGDGFVATRKLPVRVD